MARQRNQAVFVFFVIMVLFAVSFVFSFPRESRYGLIPRRVLTRERFQERFPWKLKRMLSGETESGSTDCVGVVFTLYRTTFAPAEKPYCSAEPLFTNENSDFGVISVTERRWVAPFSKLESHISDRCSHYAASDSFACWQEKPCDCKDKRPDCKDVIQGDDPRYLCRKHKGECDEYCGECAAACKDIESAYDCFHARMNADQCRERKWKDGCELTCCNCDKMFSKNCN